MKMKDYADNKRRAKPMELSPGDQVLVKKKPDNKFFNPEPFQIVDVKGNQVTAENSDGRITRNSTFFHGIPQQTQVSTEVLPSQPVVVNDNFQPEYETPEHLEDSISPTYSRAQDYVSPTYPHTYSEVLRSPPPVQRSPLPVQSSPLALRRSTRERRPPIRFGYDEYDD
uniref:Uncharacterized protein n=1 Tax=Cacopsylla melanoneura TaxID=428564 RepID=A0A8D9AZ58_9HEMI